MTTLALLVLLATDPAPKPLPTGVLLRINADRLVFDRFLAGAVSPDGTTLAVARRDHVALHDVRTGAERSWFPSHGSPTGGLHFTADGKRVIQADRGVSIPDGLLPGFVEDYRHSPDGRQLLARTVVADPTAIGVPRKPTARLVLACIDLPTGEILGQVETRNANGAALSGDGETVAVGLDGCKGLRILHLPSGTERAVVPFQPARFAFSTDGKLLLALDAGTASLVDARTGKKIRDMEGRLSRSAEVAGLSDGGRTVAVVERDAPGVGRFVLWDGTTGKRIPRPDGHDGAVSALAYSPDGKHLVTGGRTVCLWNATTGAHVRRLTTHDDEVCQVAFSPDGKLVASSDWSGVARITSTGGTAVGSIPNGDKSLKPLAFSRDGKTLFVGDGPTVIAWDVAEGRLNARTPTRRPGGVAALTPDGGRALTLSAPARVWSLAPLRELARVHRSPAAAGELEGDRWLAAQFSPDGYWLATSRVGIRLRPLQTAGPEFCLWEAGTGKLVRHLAGTVPRLLAFSPDGRLASVDDGRITLWDTTTGEQLDRWTTSPVSLAFSPDGRRLAAGYADHSVLVWDVSRR